MNKKHYARASKKLKEGPGGLRCPCCSPFHAIPAEKAKPKIRRIARRCERQRLHRQFDIDGED